MDTAQGPGCAAYKVRLFVLQPVALCLSVFAASLFGISRLDAQTGPATGVSLTDGLPLPEVSMQPAVRVEISGALRAMDDAELRLTYARIHAAFREFLGHDDLSVARALIDYAALAQDELNHRDLPRPEGSDSPAGMAIAFELVL